MNSSCLSIDFADFAGAPEPSPASISPVTPAASASPAFQTGPFSVTDRPFTKWYRVWERTKPADFVQEAFILPFILLVVAVHFWGTRKNKRKAKSWIQAHEQVLQNEFAVVGFGGRKAPSVDAVESTGLLKANASDELVIPEELLKEKTAQEYSTYATGRRNVAFVNIKLSMYKRYNPLMFAAEWILSLFFESFSPPVEKMDAVSYAFDGKEKDLVPTPAGDSDSLEQKGRLNSIYDGFVWAIVNKDSMKKLRDDRYDVSLTYTKDHPKLPSWATVMSESAEVTETLLTPELVKAVEQAGDGLTYMIVTDQSIDKPTTYDIIPLLQIPILNAEKEQIFDE